MTMTRKPATPSEPNVLSSLAHRESVGIAKVPVHAFGTCHWNRKTIVRLEPVDASSPNASPRTVYSLEAHVAFPAPTAEVPNLFELARRCMIAGTADSAARRNLRFAVVASACPLKMTEPERSVVDDILMAYAADANSPWHLRAFLDTCDGETRPFIELSAEVPLYISNGGPLPSTDKADWDSIERFVHPHGNVAALDLTLKQTVVGRLHAAPGAAVVLGFA